MSIRVYEPTEKKFNNNGLKALHPLFAEITKVKDGDYFLEIEDVLDNLEYYQKGMIIRTNTPWDIQGFRCDNPRVENNRVYVKAWHLFYDSKNYVIPRNHKIYGKTCDEAIKEYKNYVNYAIECPFSDSKISTMSSDITTEADTEIEDMSLYDVFEYLRTVYLGHFVRDNFDVAINQSIGEDRGVVLAYNKNITDMKVEENWDDVCTKILPYTMVGEEKITLDTLDYNSPVVRLEDIGMDNPYDIPYTKIVEFKNESDSENYNNVRAWLYEEAKTYLQSNVYPKVHYKVSAEMSNVSDVGDTVHIKHPKITLDNTYIEATVDSLKYDAIREKYTEIEYGNFRKTIKSLLRESSADAVKGEIEKSTTAIKGYVADTTSGIIDLLTSNKVIYRGDDILIVDKLPKEESVNCFMISDNGVSFSSTGINGTFTKVFGANGTTDLGGSGNVGQAKIYDESGVLIASLDKDGLVLHLTGGKSLQIGNVLSSSNHRLRIRQKNTSGGTWGSWRFLQEEGVVLYNGTAGTPSSSVPLSPSISNSEFTYMEIYYSLFTSSTDHYHSVKVANPLGKTVSLMASIIDSSNVITFGVGVIEISTNKIDFVKNKAYKGTAMGTELSGANICIRKVVGYRI